jgi:hypothetical protein
MQVLVIGSALREVCGDQAALGLTFLETTRTKPRYRLYSIDDRFAALVDDPEHGIPVPGELVEVEAGRFEELLRGEPPGVTQGPVELEDGRIVSAAFGEPARMEAEARDITNFGGFAAYLAARHSGSTRGDGSA